jgi:hypothetical protein
LAWPQGVVTKIEDVFKTPDQVAKHKKGLKTLIWGVEDTMKTGFSLSWPPPIYDVDTELGAPPLFDYFPGKEIHWCDATYLDPDSDMPDPFVALQRLESTIALLKDIGAGRKPDERIPGTLVIDTGTDVWDWIQAWIDGVGKHTKEGNVLMRTEWAKAKQRWRQLILRLMAKPLHIVMTAQAQEIYQGNKPTGRFRPRIQHASPHMFDIIIHAMKWEIRDPKTQQLSVKYVAEITKCRFKKGWRKQFEEITYDKLAKALKEECGVVIE